jgi:hypothetical protein
MGNFNGWLPEGPRRGPFHSRPFLFGARAMILLLEAPLSGLSALGPGRPPEEAAAPWSFPPGGAWRQAPASPPSPKASRASGGPSLPYEAPRFAAARRLSLFQDFPRVGAKETLTWRIGPLHGRGRPSAPSASPLGAHGAQAALARPAGPRGGPSWGPGRRAAPKRPPAPANGRQPSQASAEFSWQAAIWLGALFARPAWPRPFSPENGSPNAQGPFFFA